MQICDPRGIKGIIGTAVFFFLDRFNIFLRQKYLALHVKVTRTDLRVKWRDVQPYKTTGKIIILYILICKYT